MIDRSLQREWGRQIELIRKSKGMSRQQLADLVGVADQVVVYRWERDGRAPSDGLRPKIAAALGVSANDLFAYPVPVAEAGS